MLGSTGNETIASLGHLLVGLQGDFEKFLLTAKKVRPASAEFFEGAVKLTFTQVQKATVAASAKLVAHHVSETVAAQKVIHTQMASQLPALYVDPLCKENVNGLNGKDILQVVDSEAARNFKAHMVAIMHAEQNLPLIGKALAPLGNLCTEELALLSKEQLASPNATYCELAVMQNARRALGKGESRQSLAFQVQLLITKRLPSATILPAFEILLQDALKPA